MPVSHPENDKVLIVGAGNGGLALAQVLRKQNIPYEIFERDSGLHTREQGWAIALVESLPELVRLIPNDLGDMTKTSVNAGIGEHDEFAVMNMKTGEIVTRLGPAPPGAQGFLLRADREQFRQYLWQHIPVTTGKHFSHYEEDASGVTAYFRDGSSARGSMLVGADGSASHVRGQLLNHSPESLPVLSQLIPIMGEVDLIRSQFEPLARIANAGLVGGHDQYRYMIGRRSIQPDGSTAAYYFALCFQSDDPQRDAAWVQSASKQELYDKCVECTRGVPELFSNVVKWTGPEGMITSSIKFIELVPPESLPWGRVTLLGDAAHVMVPFKGAGSNCAIKDGCDLGQMIIRRAEQEDKIGWQNLVQNYNKIMLKRGRDLVLGSRAAGQGDLSQTMDGAKRL